MPIYEFRCAKCGITTEMLIRTSLDKKAPSCPDCGSTKMERLISAPNIQRESISSAAPRCGREATCCGNETPCEHPSCE